MKKILFLPFLFLLLFFSISYSQQTSNTSSLSQLPKADPTEIIKFITSRNYTFTAPQTGTYFIQMIGNGGYGGVAGSGAGGGGGYGSANFTLRKGTVLTISGNEVAINASNYLSVVGGGDGLIGFGGAGGNGGVVSVDDIPLGDAISLKESIPGQNGSYSNSGGNGGNAGNGGIDFGSLGLNGIGGAGGSAGGNGVNGGLGGAGGPGAGGGGGGGGGCGGYGGPGGLGGLGGGNGGDGGGGPAGIGCLPGIGGAGGSAGHGGYGGVHGGVYGGGGGGGGGGIGGGGGGGVDDMSGGAGGSGIVVITYKTGPPTGPLGDNKCNDPSVNTGSKVNLSDGNLYLEKAITENKGGGLPANITLSYNSLDTYKSPFGTGWTDNYNINLTQSGDNIILMAGDGERVVYTPTTTSTYTPQPQSGYHSTLTQTATGYTLTKIDGTQYTFNAVGQLTQIKDRNNNMQTFTYTGTNLTQIIDVNKPAKVDHLEQK